MDLSERNLPFVGISIPNYNYGHYLRDCLDSILAQTYHKLEISFSDNRSTDDSLDIAFEYKKRFDAKGVFFHFHQNKQNLGSDKNSMISSSFLGSDLIYTIGSDDEIAPTFIEKCVKIFIEYPNVSTVITHREEVDDDGIVTRTPPFYNTSCIIDGESQAAVYMMAGIAVPSQRMIRRSVAGTAYHNKLNFMVAGDWFDNFLFAMGGDVAYIMEPLCRYRVHRGNETNTSERDLVGVFEHYQLINAFKTISESYGMTKPASRYNDAVEKLGDMCLRYAFKMLKSGLDDVAFRYLKLAPVFKKNIESTELYKELFSCLEIGSKDKNALISRLETSKFSVRTISYDPPEGHLKVNFT